MSQSRTIVYFDKTGPENTKELAGIVAARVAAGGIDAVAVATGSGETARVLARALPAGTRLYAVNYQPPKNGPDPEIRKEAEGLGVVFMPPKPVVRYLKDVQGQSPDSFRRLGQGMKVAFEIVMQATEVGHLKKGEKVIGVGGSSRGADVAVVAVAAGPDEITDLWISEILAKPL
jgi:hypothetical protein